MALPSTPLFIYFLFRSYYMKVNLEHWKAANVDLKAFFFFFGLLFCFSDAPASAIFQENWLMTSYPRNNFKDNDLIFFFHPSSTLAHLTFTWTSDSLSLSLSLLCSPLQTHAASTLHNNNADVFFFLFTMMEYPSRSKLKTHQNGWGRLSFLFWTYKATEQLINTVQVSCII